MSVDLKCKLLEDNGFLFDDEDWKSKVYKRVIGDTFYKCWLGVIEEFNRCKNCVILKMYNNDLPPIGKMLFFNSVDSISDFEQILKENGLTR